MKKIAAALMVVLFGGLLGCSSNPLEPETIIHGGPPHDIREYEITYRVTGNFEKCGVVYRDEKVQLVSGISAEPGWEHTINTSFDYTREPYSGMSLYLLAEENGPGGVNKSVTTEIWVNGKLRFTDTKYDDRVVVISAGPLSRLQDYSK